MISPVFIFDFDSTLVRIETLEALAELALKDAPDAAERKARIAALTDDAMNGRIGFGEALKLHEKDGQLQFTTHKDEPNQGDFINAFLRNR
mgnify:CR=1 FL=1